MAKRVNHKEYIGSVEWLIKKNELFSIYRNQGWSIECGICGQTKSLNVHHHNYSQLGVENLKDDGSGDIWNLELLCRGCHRKWHFEVGFKEEVKRSRLEKFLNFISQPKNEWLKNECSTGRL